MEKSSVILLVGLVAGAGLALFYTESNSQKEKERAPAVAREQDTAEPMETAHEELPPNHPSISDDDAPAVVWKAPDAWKSAPNPNAMRLATYKVSDDTELVVSRAGGDVATNVARWQGQFEGSPKAQQTDKTVRDMKVTTVEIDGTYTNTMDPSVQGHANWSMLAAIVQSKGRPYFFKIVGPAATVHAAKKSFDAMIDSLKPA